MHDEFRELGPLDRILSVLDQGLKTLSGAASAPSAAARPTPRPETPAPAAPPTPAAVRESAGLMRVNHAGEVAAQALYHGQALIARDPAVRAYMLGAAREEGDHLVWCAERLRALGARPSRLDPLWYAGGVTIGALAGLGGDALSLGFITETERQVEGHINEHLERLPPEDTASRAVLEQMRRDEIEHGANARARGAAELPLPLRRLMRLTAKVMTRSSYYF